MTGIFKNLGMMKAYLGFILTLISIVGCLTLCWFKGIDISLTLPTLLGIYISGKTVERTAAVMSVAKDPAADTRQVIADMDTHNQ